MGSVASRSAAAGPDPRCAVPVPPRRRVLQRRFHCGLVGRRSGPRRGLDVLVVNSSQQQWLTRNSVIGTWSNGVWNQVFSGVVGAPAQNFPPQTTSQPSQQHQSLHHPGAESGDPGEALPLRQQCRQLQRLRPGVTKKFLGNYLGKRLAGGTGQMIVLPRFWTCNVGSGGSVEGRLAGGTGQISCFHVFWTCNVGSGGSVEGRLAGGTGQISYFHVFWTCNAGSRGSVSLPRPMSDGAI